MATHTQKQRYVLTMSTVAFTVNFAIWTMFSVIGIDIRQELGLNASQFGLMIATPVLTGSLCRLPMVFLADYFGGRIIFFIQMLMVAASTYGLSYANLYWHYLVTGLFIGLAGGSFAIGIAYSSSWFAKDRQNYVVGFFGLGNIGAAISNIAAPLILVAYGWRMVPQVYGIVLLLVAVLFLLFTFKDPEQEAKKQQIKKTPWREQFKPLNDLRVWRFSLYYFVVFGGFVALTLWLPSYFVEQYKMSILSASLLTLIFTLPGGIIRAVGGWLSDEHGARQVNWIVFWVAIVCLFFLSYPPTSMVIHGVDRDVKLSFEIGIEIFVVLIFIIGIAMGFGKASVYRLIHEYYPEDTGVVSGFVGAVGTFGGFVLPVIFGLILEVTSIRSSCFMFLYGLLGFCMIWMYYAIKTEEHLERIRHAMSSNFLAE